MKSIAYNFRRPTLVLAAWYSFFTPLVVILSLFIFLNYVTDHHLTRDFCDVLRWVCVSSLISGIVSLFGMRRYGARRILPAAIAGILFSAGAGYAAFVIMALSSISC
jgi:chromate transport protein ChrA